MLYTLPTHNIQMQTPLCADIMSYYKKKNPRGWIYQSNKQTASITTRCPQNTGRSAGAVAKSAGGEIHSYVPRDAPQDMISLHKHY